MGRQRIAEGASAQRLRQINRYSVIVFTLHLPCYYAWLADDFYPFVVALHKGDMRHALAAGRKPASKPTRSTFHLVALGGFGDLGRAILSLLSLTQLPRRLRTGVHPL